MNISSELLSTPKSAPFLEIPQSESIVTVRIIDTTAYGHVSASLVFTPSISGLDTFIFPSFAFLITNARNETAPTHILFDAGMRKDWEKSLPPDTIDFVTKYMPFTIEKDIDEILDEDPGQLDIKTQDISSIIWSHHHFDHRGNVTKFPSSTKVIWGPGSTQEYCPGYPMGPQSSVLEDELKGRTIQELRDEDFTMKIGGFPAHDFFGDGSFYLLSSPGHTVGHLSGLARVTTGANTKPTFVFMGGDCCHYAGIFRPSEYLPLPREIPSAPGSTYGAAPCPGSLMMQYAHPSGNPTEPFLKANQGVNVDQPEAERSIASMQEFDADEDVLVCIAHDGSLVGNIDFYPKAMNDWKSKGFKQSVRWGFCGDFDVKAAKDAKGG